MFVPIEWSRLTPVWLLRLTYQTSPFLVVFRYTTKVFLMMNSLLYDCYHYYFLHHHWETGGRETKRMKDEEWTRQKRMGRKEEGEKVGDKDKQMFQVITQIISFNSDMNRTPDTHNIYTPKIYENTPHRRWNSERGRRERKRLREKKE